MNRVVNFIIAFFILQTNLLAQIPGLTQFTTNNGLASNTIYDSVQDENGFMWFATDYGISKFDGLSFKNYTITDGLPGNEILSFYKDSKNRIWMVAFNGRIGYIKNGKLFNKDNEPFLNQLKFTSYISDIFEDSNGQIWFCKNMNNIKALQENLTIKSYNSKNNTKFKYSSFIIEDLDKNVRVLTYKRKDNDLFIISKVISEKPNSEEWQEFDPNNYTQASKERLNGNLGVLLRNNDKIIKNISNYFIHDQNNFLSKTYKVDDYYWVTNINDGALIFNKSDNYCTPKKTLKNVRTTRAYIDAEKNIWIGSQSNGVYLFPNLHIIGTQFDDKNRNDLHTVQIFQNKLVIGNERSEIITLNKNSLKTIETSKVNISPKRIRQFLEKNNKLYILSDFNIHELNTNFNLTKIKNMYNSELYASTLKNFKDISITNEFIYTANANGVGKINLKTLKPEKIWNKRSTSILNFEKENLWIGTTSGLYQYNNKNVEKNELNEQFDNSIIYALENSEKGLLIGSNAYGLGILKNDTFSVISKKNGLLSNYIKSIHIDPNNKIWLSTNFGLNCVELGIDNKIISIKSYTTSDGLYSNDVRSSYVEGNKVYVATSKGLNIIDLSKEVSSILAPNVHINEVLLNNSIIKKTNGQIFENHLNNAQFNFSGISFKSLGNITFKYRLKGLESDWISTKTNYVRYSSLPPNDYTFELKAVSKNNLVSAPIFFSFTISPPIYQTWWFNVISIVILIAIIIAFLYQRNLKIKRKQRTKEQISNLRYQALNAQMNPHFINNLLVNINSLADKGETKEVKDSLDKFAELVNLILSSTKSNLINLNNEIEMAKLYLELQKLRFNKNITYHINTESIPTEELEYILVPPMILQPIIENSFKHGFKNDNKDNNITVNFKIKNNQYLYCEILDNGKGIENNGQKQSNSTGISFSNINERLNLINESKSKEELVLLTNIKNEFNTLVGLKVTLKIPLISF